jgi:hypothetical protein
VTVAELFEGVGSVESGMDSAIIRLAAAVEKVGEQLARRRDDYAHLGEDLKDFMKQYRDFMKEREAREASNGPRAAAERDPERVPKKRGKPASEER